MKKIAIVLLLIIAVFYSNTLATGTDQEDIDDEFDVQSIIGQQLEGVDAHELQNVINGIVEGSGNENLRFDVGDTIKKMVSGDYTFDLAELFYAAARALFFEVLANIGMMGQIIILAVMVGILSNIQSSFGESSVGDMAYYSCYILIIVIIIKSFTTVMELGRSAIDNMVVFMQAILPILMTFMISMGGFASASIFQPANAILITLISTFFRDFLLPLIMLSAVLVLVSNISSKIQISKLVILLKNVCTWTLVSVITIFVGVLAIQGAAAASFDGVSIRTMKFAIDTFIPIIGGMFSDSIDTIIRCSLLVKNAVGIFGLVAVGIICVFPALKIGAIILIFKLTGALIEPICSKELPQCMDDIANSILLVLLTVLSVGFMFFITITLIVASGNISVMMR